RVVEVLAVVEDAALAGPEEEVSLGEDLVPELLDRRHLREEPVTTQVEAPAVALGGPTDATDDRVGLQHGGRPPRLGQLVCGGEPCRACADDDRLHVLCRYGSSGSILRAPRGRRAAMVSSRL